MERLPDGVIQFSALEVLDWLLATGYWLLLLLA
jgi:hypothetical protein